VRTCWQSGFSLSLETLRYLYVVLNQPRHQIIPLFDTAILSVRDDACSGTSTRCFLSTNTNIDSHSYPLYSSMFRF
jgi:hypothetical protein